MRGQHADAVLADRVLGERVARDLLAGQAVKEQPRAAWRQVVGEPRRGLEQREHRVQVMVGGAVVLGPLLPLAASPDSRQTAHSTSSALLPASSCLAAIVSRLATRQAGAATRSLTGAAAAESVSASPQRHAAERPPQLAQAEAVGLAERAGQQLGRGLLVEPARLRRRSAAA